MDDSEKDDEPIKENVPTKIEGLQGLETVRRVLETEFLGRCEIN
jgi:hypothetical protein